MSASAAVKYFPYLMHLPILPLSAETPTIVVDAISWCPGVLSFDFICTFCVLVPVVTYEAGDCGMVGHTRQVREKMIKQCRKYLQLRSCRPEIPSGPQKASPACAGLQCNLQPAGQPDAMAGSGSERTASFLI